MRTKNTSVEFERRMFAFLDEVVVVSKKHRLSISHEDSQGGFEVVPYNEDCTLWLIDAYANDKKVEE